MSVNTCMNNKAKAGKRSAMSAASGPVLSGAIHV